MDARMMRQDMGGRRPPRKQSFLHPVNGSDPLGPDKDAWSSGEASVQIVDGTTGGREYVRRRNYIPQEQQTLNSIPTREDVIAGLLDKARHYEGLPGIDHWSSGNPSVRLIDTNPAYGPPESTRPHQLDILSGLR